MAYFPLRPKSTSHPFFPGSILEFPRNFKENPINSQKSQEFPRKSWFSAQNGFFCAKWRKTERWSRILPPKLGRPMARGSSTQVRGMSPKKCHSQAKLGFPEAHPKSATDPLRGSQPRMGNKRMSSMTRNSQNLHGLSL